MANSFRCIQALNNAAGRTLSYGEVAQMMDRIKKAGRDIAAGRVQPPTGPHNLATPDGVMMAAADQVAQEMIGESIRKQRNAHLQVAKQAERQAQIQAMTAAKIDPIDAVRRTIANDADGRSDQFSLEARVTGTSAELRRKLQDTWEALGNDFFGFIQQKDKIRALITEMKGQDSGDPMAKKGAEAWLNLSEEARQWYNSAGGDVGHLEDWGFPQHHSQEAVARAGRDEWLRTLAPLEQVKAVARGTPPPVDWARNKWVGDMMPLIDRSRYTDLAGTPLTDPQIHDLLSNAFETISTNGANKIEPGQFQGSGARANRHAEERQLHFKDAESVMAYWQNYGEKTFPDILLGHIENMAKDIGFLEHFGPNPDSTYRLLRDQAYKAAADVGRGELDKVDKSLVSLDRLYDYASGKSLPIADRRVATFFDSLRNLNVAGKLGSAVWSSVYGDKVTLEAMNRVNNLPVFQSWYNELRLLNPANAQERRLLQRQGLMLDYMRNAMFRYGDDLGKSSWTGKLANGIMRASGMGAVNEWRRGGFGVTMMSAIGHEVGAKDFAQLGPNDMHFLTAYGITEGDWKIWKLAKLEDMGHGNKNALTPEAIARIPDADLKAAGIDPGARRDAVVKFLGALNSESNLAIVEPGWSERASQSGGLQRGNIRDEIMRSFWQFKSFPIAQFHKMLDIAMSRPTTGGKAGYVLALPVLQTVAGAMMLQTQQLLSGQDPRPMNDWKFAAAAFIKGGSLGIYGDFLYSQSGTTRYGTGPLEALAGPSLGTLGDFTTFAIQAGNAIGTDKETHFGARALQLGKGLIPGGNLWYTKAAIDHILFQNAQEMLSPGYLGNMRARTQQDYGTDWWWAPGEMTPERAPNMGNALESNP